MAWRSADGGGELSGVTMDGSNMGGAIYSAHLDGQIRVWTPQLEGLDDEDEHGTDAAARKKAQKRNALGNVYQILMGKGIFFT